MSAPAILLYSKEGKSLEKITFSFEHDAYDIITVSHTETCEETIFTLIYPFADTFTRHFLVDKDVRNEALPDLSRKKHPPIDVEYIWVSVQEEDLNLGVKVMFMTTIFMVMGITWVILMSYDRDSTRKYFFVVHALMDLFSCLILNTYQRLFQGDLARLLTEVYDSTICQVLNSCS